MSGIYKIHSSMIPFCLLLLVVMAPVVLPARADLQQRLSGDIRLSGGYDSNAHETIAHTRHVSDAFVRTEAGCSWQPARLSSGGPLVRLRFASEHYEDIPTDDRLLLLTSLGWRFNRSDRFWWDLHLQGNQSLFPTNETRDTQRFEIQHNGELTLHSRRRIRWGLRMLYLDSDRWEAPGRRSGRFFIELPTRLTPEIWFSPRLESGFAKYDHQAWYRPDPGSAQADPVEERQFDKQYLIGFGLSHIARPLIRFNYGLRIVSSNNFGFSHTRHEFQLSAGFMLPRRISLQMISRWQHTLYRDADYDIYLPGEDAEDQDLGARSGITLQLRRPFGSGLTADCQLNWQYNEVLASHTAYEKIRLLLGIQYSRR